MAMIRSLCLTTSLLLLAAYTPSVGAEANQGEFDDFAARMEQRHGMDRERVMAWLNGSQHRQSIIDAISSPAEGLPWHRYRGIFVKSGRIRGGTEFWHEQRDLLTRAEQRYGVPPGVIVAIMGVETGYGRHSGSHRVIDALRTLAFDYPPRSEFFRSELETYLLLTREQGIDPMKPKGSYAGAMGMPQFIASSYRDYAVDFNDNGQVDLWNETADAIGSVANYLAEHGWRQGEPIATPARVEGDGWRQFDTSGLKPNTTVGELRSAGVEPAAGNYPDSAGARLLVLDGGDGNEYWVARHNFYVVTRYNHSALYALAVHQLGEAIGERVTEQ